MLKVTFCITCKNRTQHLKLTLLQNLCDNADYPAKFVLLNYGSTDDFMEYMQDSDILPYIYSGILTFYTHENGGTFRMAHAKNMAHRLAMNSGATILVNLDADNFTGPGFAAYIAEQFKNKKNIFLATGGMIPGITPRGIMGRIVCTAEAFLLAGGYDEKFNDYGPDDKDFNLRLRRLGYELEVIPSEFMNCVRHNDKMRFKEYPHMQDKTRNEYEAMIDCENTIVNYGSIGCGIVRKNFYETYNADCLDKLPTRIFGIGMHKTGTTALHHAFKILGFNSAHWTGAHWAKAIWREMNTMGRSSTLEKHYALSDMPISNLFRKLDKGYPGSKFILTTRNEDDWIRSVRNHYNPQLNPWVSGWANDPFTSIIHKHTYGIIEFDEPTMRARFRRHNLDVLNHFKDRPNDLLVLQDKQTEWTRLCKFLGKDIPSIPYPQINFSG